MADHLEDEEVIERIRTWWRENGVSLVGGVVLVVGGWLGWNWYDSSANQRAEDAFDQFSRYVELRQAGDADSDEALRVLAVLDEEHEGSAGHLLSLLYRSGDAVAADEMQVAAGHLEQVVEGASDAQLRELARMRLARVYLEQDRIDEAQDILNSPGSAGFLSMRHELRGDIQIQLGDAEAARASYQAAIEAEEASGGGNQWPFLSMKLYGIGVSDESEVSSSAEPQATEAPHGAELMVDADAKSDADEFEQGLQSDNGSD